ncbi:MAG TPA: hypothetical protein VGI19_14625 [Candidatus Cybelea sp.]|jgi:hypothetical protein
MTASGQLRGHWDRLAAWPKNTSTAPVAVRSIKVDGAAGGCSVSRSGDLAVPIFARDFDYRFDLRKYPAGGDPFSELENAPELPCGPPASIGREG